MDLHEQQMGFITGSPAPTAEERQWGMLAHLSAIIASFFVLPFLGPLIVMLTKGKESAWVEKQAKEALNFHLTVMGALIVSGLLMFVLVGFCLFPLVAIGSTVLTIVGAIKANEGQMYRYPVNVRLVK
jgi:hypothetical protein